MGEINYLPLYIYNKNQLMNYSISEEKLKKVMFRYLDSWDWINGLIKKMYERGAWAFTKWTVEDDEFYDNDVPFQLYEEDYFDKVVGYKINPANKYPLLIPGRDVEDELEKIFGLNDLTKQILLDWFNKTYNEDAKRI
jgi:hypothetical protein